jgi:hypothetical protein
MTSYVGVGIFLDINEICKTFGCSEDEVGQKIMKINWEKDKKVYEIAVVKIEKDDKERYFIGVLQELTYDFCLTDTNTITPDCLLSAGISKDKFQTIAFHKYSRSCRIIYRSCSNDFLKELFSIEENDTLKLTLLEEKNGYKYKCAHNENSDGEYYRYKFITEEPITFTHEGIVSGGSNTVILFATETYIYTITCGIFLRMKICDILPYELPDIRRDGTPGSYIFLQSIFQWFCNNANPFIPFII